MHSLALAAVLGAGQEGQHWEAGRVQHWRRAAGEEVQRCYQRGMEEEKPRELGSVQHGGQAARNWVQQSYQSGSVRAEMEANMRALEKEGLH